MKIGGGLRSVERFRLAHSDYIIVGCHMMTHIPHSLICVKALAHTNHADPGSTEGQGKLKGKYREEARGKG